MAVVDLEQLDVVSSIRCIKAEENLLRSSLHILAFLSGIALMIGIRLLRGLLA